MQITESFLENGKEQNHETLDALSECLRGLPLTVASPLISAFRDNPPASLPMRLTQICPTPGRDCRESPYSRSEPCLVSSSFRNTASSTEWAGLTRLSVELYSGAWDSQKSYRSHPRKTAFRWKVRGRIAVKMQPEGMSR